jgi:hypothetical protein
MRTLASATGDGFMGAGLTLNPVRTIVGGATLTARIIQLRRHLMQAQHYR